MLLLPAHAPRPDAIPLLDRRGQPELDQPQYVPVDDAAGHRSEEVHVRNRVEVLRQVGVDDGQISRCVSLTASIALRRGRYP